MRLTVVSTAASSLMRSITSCVKVPGQRTWDTRPLEHASWAVSFLPLSSSSLAWNRREHLQQSAAVFLETQVAKARPRQRP